MTFALDLPAPSADALAVSNALGAQIRAEIARAGGWIDFARYMELALYAPGLGYYSAGSAKLGAGGDFVTAPELSDLLARALARTLRHDLERLAAPAILEVGAGTGALAAQLLEALADGQPSYLILETSAELRERQQRMLARFAPRVRWLDRLPERPFEGAIIANEVLDALPVTCFVKRGHRAVPRGVVARANELAWADGPSSRELDDAVSAVERALGRSLEENYRSEISRSLPAWIRTLADALEQGSMVLVDYGLVRREYYHEQRSGGTLRCHYRHRAHDDPFVYPGLQDITAWVDFSACADAAREAGLVVEGFTTQAQFLLATLAAEPPPNATDSAAVRALSSMKTLVLPGEMGERFKVMLLRKRSSGAALPGRDLRGRL
jgi:SAM-dependent MidA family methyltransferase